MKLTNEETSTVDMRPTRCSGLTRPNGSESENISYNKTESLTDRLTVQVTNFEVDDEKVVRHREEMRRRSEKSCRKEKAGMNLRKCSILDMTISRSYRHGLSVTLLLWTSVFLLFLTKGVYSTSEDHPRYDRYSKYDQDTEVQGYVTPEAQNSYIIHFLRELIQRQQQQQQQRANQQQLQMYNNGEDLSENQIDWRKVPLPLLYQIRAIINDGSKEEDKRGSYMSLCHFKICNLG